jgi:signal transduction histidine kinase/DNA-binding response OmpR family regulator
MLLAELGRVVAGLDAGADVRRAAAELRGLVERLVRGHERLSARLDEILQVVTAMTALDFRKKLAPREDDDWLINALTIGLNITGDELRRRAEALTEARDRALAANRAKTAFLANMSHELRTPLNAIIGYSELLRDECEGTLDPRQLADLDRIVSAGRHLLSLIKDTLDLSKIEAGKVELVVEPFALDPLIDEVVGTVQTLVESRGNRLIVERGPGLGQMLTDRTKLAQILYNLLSNAIKFTTLGTIRFAARRDAGELVFTVEDTGIGIPRDKLDLVFGAFNQADEETARRFGGTGLGLTITRHFSEMMGGEISVTSEVGAGSTFTLTLPAELSNASGARRPGEARRSGPRDLVLLVSDDPRLAEALHHVLVPVGVPVIPVAAGPDAPRLVGQLRPAAVVLDGHAADLGSLLLALGADPDLAVIPRFVIGDLTGQELAARGGAGSLARPLRPEEVHAALAPRLRAPPRLGTVLLVADDDLRTQAGPALTRRGWRVHEAGDVDAVRERFARGRVIDAVVLDLGLACAAEVAELLRRSPSGRRRAVVGVGVGAPGVVGACTAVVGPPGGDLGPLLAALALDVHAAGPKEARG